MDATEALPTQQDEQRTDAMDVVLTVAKRLANDGEGAMFVLAREDRVRPQLSLHFPQMRYDGAIMDEGMDAVLARLATLDGAVVVSPEGKLLAYGARLRTQRTIPGFGTRHAAAKGYTDHDEEATVVLVSEETGWVKVFQKGQPVVEIDPADVAPSTIHKISRYLVSRDAALLAAAGISAATLGVGAVGLLVLGGSYVVVRTAFDTISGILKGDERPRKR
ncbi:MAG: DNA integrity scanning protein DisA nucleotide-binding domain protein [bacterium]